MPRVFRDEDRIRSTWSLESVRREAYTEGYAAGIRAVVEFSTSRTAKPKATVTKATARKAASEAAASKAAVTRATAAKSTTATTAAPKRWRRAQAKPAPRKTRRGDNMRRIAEAMMTRPNHSGPAAAIKKVLAGKGHDIAYTSIRHGLGQLQARGEASVAADGKTWSYTAPAS